MPGLCTTTSRAALLLAASLAGGNAIAGLSFGVLDACQPVREVIQRLENRSANGRGCRQPRDDLERQYASRVALRGMKLCLLREPLPAPFASFSCADVPVLAGASIVCFKGADLRAIREYKANYDERHAQTEQRYLAAAAACPLSTGDASRVPVTMFPMFLAEVAAFEIGFAAHIRPGGDGERIVVHGFAETDPELRGDTPSAIEFVSFSTGAKRPAEYGNRRQVGEWTIRIEDDRTMAQETETMTRDQGLDMRLASTTFRFEKQSGGAEHDKAGMLRESNRTILKHLRGEGFKRIPADAIKAQTGLDKSSFFEVVRKGMPYGTRRMLRRDAGFDLLIHDRLPACGQAGEGAIGAFVMRMNAEAGVRSDYGAISLTLLGLGDCARKASADHYIKRLMSHVSETIGEELPGQ